MDQRLPEVRDPLVSVDVLARAAGIDRSAHQRTGLTAQEISTGVPYILLPVATRADVDAAEPDTATLRALTSAFGIEHVGIYLFSVENRGDDVTAYSRMFAAGLGIAEDPATGSACGPLGSYLVQHKLVPPEAASKIVSWQGVAMGRPSRIHIAIAQNADGTISRVQVGGQAVMVARGHLTLEL
jgi:trans-2,3-dihydro-3-hydroxyanthranilate isomerase